MAKGTGAGPELYFPYTDVAEMPPHGPAGGQRVWTPHPTSVGFCQVEGEKTPYPPIPRPHDVKPWPHRQGLQDGTEAWGGGTWLPGPPNLSHLSVEARRQGHGPWGGQEKASKVSQTRGLGDPFLRPT
ncbi:hypothetical protein HJG60_011399 [Phyllostomus discolor]|uniref:Uncharacterized protein n=1 Tax=Phyllostomus discolor TaxID=89673 RepID=A0A834E7U3_9CHIR|nr:hypothetical protein HJG60_011399 [Phyllostomus discolor]